MEDWNLWLKHRNTVRTGCGKHHERPPLNFESQKRKSAIQNRNFPSNCGSYDHLGSHLFPAVSFYFGSEVCQLPKQLCRDNLDTNRVINVLGFHHLVASKNYCPGFAKMNPCPNRWHIEWKRRRKLHTKQHHMSPTCLPCPVQSPVPGLILPMCSLCSRIRPALLCSGFLAAVLWDTVFSGHVFRYKHHSPTMANLNVP